MCGPGWAAGRPGLCARTGPGWRRLCLEEEPGARSEGLVSSDGTCSILGRAHAGLSRSCRNLSFTGHSDSTPLSRPAPSPDSGIPRKDSPSPCLPLGSRILQHGGQLIAAAWHRRAWDRLVILGDAGSTTAPVVNDHRAGGGQGGAGRPVVVAAQQQINGMRASRGGRDEDPHHRPGGQQQARSPRAGRLDQAARSSGGVPAAWPSVNPPAALALRRGNLILIQPGWTAASRLNRGLALVPDGTFGPKHPGRPPCDRGPERING